VLPRSADVVVCGAGIAGLAAAWHLAVRRGVADVVVVDERPPLSLTSDKSTECYRNWWPDPAMVGLTGRSIELLDELAARTGNAIALNRNGYLYLTATAEGARALERGARAVSALGAGPLRIRRGAPDDPPYREPAWDRPEPTADGADLFLDAGEIRRRWPWATEGVRAALHARRCGWLSAQQLGMLWLEEAREAGARLVEGRVVGVEIARGRVAGVEIARGDTVERLACGALVNAAGPFVGDVAALVGVELPVFHELHRKLFFDDHLGIVPRESGLVVWSDPVTIDWSEEERAGLAAEPETAALARELPAGVHFRPEGGPESRSALLLWNYHADPVERRFPLPDDPLHVPVVVRGVARALPGFAAYAEAGRRPYVDGGYYTKTRENRPLVGPCGPEGSFLIGALSGFGIMAAPAAGELLAAAVTGAEPPPGAAAFALDRYRDPAYLASIAGGSSGQL
jgi:glycine/D-amino acid oxidase-like deaminating enzyme